MKFSDLNLHPDLAKTITDIGFTECTPIQEASIPIIQEGKDISGLAQTGTGKTGAYLIPVIDRILKSKQTAEPTDQDRFVGFKEWREPHFILVLVPTRELAQQVQDNFNTFSKGTGLKSVAIYGGTSYEPQKKALAEGVQFVIATPGRLIDLFKDKVVDLHQVRAIIFDEADRMFDMGFKDDMRYLLTRIPRERQMLIFSATMNFEVSNVAYEFGSEPIEVNISKDQTTAENVKDEIFHVGDSDKPSYLYSLIKRDNPKQVIVFTNFKYKVERVARFLSDNGFPAVGISSLLSQAQRNKVMGQFKDPESKQNILVATDVAARGLDIKGVDMVVNFEMPDSAENYVHRIGRTGRAGAEGVAFSLVSDRDVEALSRIHDYVDRKLDIGWLEDKEILTDVKKMQEFSPRVSYDKKPGRDGRRNSGGKGGPRRDGAKGGPRRDQKRDGRPGAKKFDGPKRDHKAGGSKPYSKKKSVHRDNDIDGRSSGSSAKVASSKPANFKKKSSAKKKNVKFKSTYKHKNNRPKFDPTQKRTGKKPAAAAPQGLGQKVSSFFKDLFS